MTGCGGPFGCRCAGLGEIGMADGEAPDANVSARPKNPGQGGSAVYPSWSAQPVEEKQTGSSIMWRLC